MPWSMLLLVLHLVGLALAVGSATLKLSLLLRTTADRAFVPTFLAVSPALTRQIAVGMLLLTLSGIGWLVLGHDFTPVLLVKVILVAAIWVLGPVIDKAVEPRYRRLAPVAGSAATPGFVRVERQYVAWEAVATLLFYVIILVWLWPRG